MERREQPPTHQEIETRAYELWMQNGRLDGSAEQNWLEAERELHTAVVSHRTTDLVKEQGGSVQR